MSETLPEPNRQIPLQEAVGLVPPPLVTAELGLPASEVVELPAPQPAVESTAEMQLENFAVHRGDPQTSNAEGVHHRAEISPRHHQEHIDKSTAIVPDIAHRSTDEQDLIGAVLELGDEALDDAGVGVGSAGNTLVDDPTQAYVEAHVENSVRNRMASNDESLRELDALFPDGKPAHVEQMVAKVHADTERLKASIPDVTAAAGEEYQEGKAAETKTADFERAVEARVKAMPWENEAIKKFLTKEASLGVRDRYEDLVEREHREPQPDDYIKIPYGLKPESEEYQKLIASGVSSEALDSYAVTRKDLLDAGYFFVNSLGGGEKPILQGAFTDPAHPDKQLDFSKRKLLTRDELEAAYRYQQSQGMGLSGQSLEKVRADMLLFMDSSMCPLPFKTEQDAADAIYPKVADDPRWEVGTPDERERAVAYLSDKERLGFVELASQPEPGNMNIDRRRLWATRALTAAGYRLQFRNGLVGGTMPIRRDKLYNDASPFLESGFRFGENPDVYVVLPDEDEGRRLNMVNVHLAGGHPDFPGLSEQGSADWDQQYMSVGEYAKQIYPPEASTEEVGDLMRRGSGTMLTAGEQQIAGDMQFLDPEGLRKRLITVGQRKIIERAQN